MSCQRRLSGFVDDSFGGSGHQSKGGGARRDDDDGGRLRYSVLSVCVPHRADNALACFPTANKSIDDDDHRAPAKEGESGWHLRGRRRRRRR